jgi:beta-glucosidase-like glycosyl hydrolase
MCSYNRLNNSYGCANSLTQNGLLKTELGFQVRWLISDNSSAANILLRVLWSPIGERNILE